MDRGPADGGAGLAGRGGRERGRDHDAGVAYLAWSRKFSAGVVISASHNPWTDNGIKIFSEDGYKLPDARELAIEQEIFALLNEGTPAETNPGINPSLSLGTRKDGAPGNDPTLASQSARREGGDPPDLKVVRRVCRGRRVARGLHSLAGGGACRD